MQIIILLKKDNNSTPKFIDGVFSKFDKLCNDNNLLTKVEIHRYMESLIIDEFSFLFNDKNKFMLGDIDTNLDISVRIFLIDYQESLLLYVEKLQNFLKKKIKKIIKVLKIFSCM